THKSRHRGSALISALFIMTLVAIAATAMSTRLQLDIYRTHLTLLTDKLYLASQQVSFWAMSELNHRKTPFPKIDKEGALLTFPTALQNSYPELETTGKLFDLQGRFNLNNLTDKNYYRVFLNLLEVALPDMNKKDREAIALATQFWISPYKPGRGNDQLVNAYLKQNPPYYQSGQLMQNVSEFRLINGVTAKTYRILEPYITALPDVTPINIDTAPKTVLMSLRNGLTEEQI
ncbi:MAG: type II secretion system minor pseudopilin GspK, partial [Prosthecobacter sp.]|nr:type II secretion system minor pseudopilin GspK [Prosthecobacter sp.]